MSHIPTFMQIDLQNLFYAAKDRGQRLDFEKIHEHFSRREAEFLTEAAVYMIRSDFDSHKFEAKLKNIGFTLRIKHAKKSFKATECPVRISKILNKNLNWDNLNPRDRRVINEFMHGDERPVYGKTNHDTNIVVECLDRIHSFEKWILMSGDGDFADLAAYLKKKGKQIEIWSFEESYNSALAPYADRMNFIDAEFFFRKPALDLFGPYRKVLDL